MTERRQHRAYAKVQPRHRSEACPRERALRSADAFGRILPSEWARPRVKRDARLEPRRDAVTTEAAERHERSVAQ